MSHKANTEVNLRVELLTVPSVAHGSADCKVPIESLALGLPESAKLLNHAAAFLELCSGWVLPLCTKVR